MSDVVTNDIDKALSAFNSGGTKLLQDNGDSEATAEPLTLHEASPPPSTGPRSTRSRDDREPPVRRGTYMSFRDMMEAKPPINEFRIYRIDGSGEPVFYKQYWTRNVAHFGDMTNLCIPIRDSHPDTIAFEMHGIVKGKDGRQAETLLDKFRVDSPMILPMGYREKEKDLDKEKAEKEEKERAERERERERDRRMGQMHQMGPMGHPFQQRQPEVQPIEMMEKAFELTERARSSAQSAMPTAQPPSQDLAAVVSALVRSQQEQQAEMIRMMKEVATPKVDMKDQALAIEEMKFRLEQEKLAEQKAEREEARRLAEMEKKEARLREEAERRERELREERREERERLRLEDERRREEARAQAEREKESVRLQIEAMKAQSIMQMQQFEQNAKQQREEAEARRLLAEQYHRERMDMLQKQHEMMYEALQERVEQAESSQSSPPSIFDKVREMESLQEVLAKMNPNAPKGFDWEKATNLAIGAVASFAQAHQQAQAQPPMRVLPPPAPRALPNNGLNGLPPHITPPAPAAATPTTPSPVPAMKKKKTIKPPAPAPVPAPSNDPFSAFPAELEALKAALADPNGHEEHIHTLRTLLQAYGMRHPDIGTRMLKAIANDDQETFLGTDEKPGVLLTFLTGLLAKGHVTNEQATHLFALASHVFPGIRWVAFQENGFLLRAMKDPGVADPVEPVYEEESPEDKASESESDEDDSEESEDDDDEDESDDDE